VAIYVCVTDVIGLRVLIVEDEFLLAMAMEATLSELGHQVIGTARTPSAALSFIQDNADRLDAVTLDLNLGGESAHGVAAHLASNCIPFIVVTGYGDARRLAPFDVMPVLRKPFLEEDLVKALNSLRVAEKSH
jgi:CheY-like chemotaxis protein